jgi:chromosome segregation ATPase
MSNLEDYIRDQEELTADEEAQIAANARAKKAAKKQRRKAKAMKLRDQISRQAVLIVNLKGELEALHATNALQASAIIERDGRIGALHRDLNWTVGTLRRERETTADMSRKLEGMTQALLAEGKNRERDLETSNKEIDRLKACVTVVREVIRSLAADTYRAAGPDLPVGPPMVIPASLVEAMHAMLGPEYELTDLTISVYGRLFVLPDLKPRA